MEQIATFHRYILDKLRALLTKSFCDQENDPDRCAAQEQLIETNWNECSKAIETYHTSIDFNERIDKLKAELDRLEREENDGMVTIRTSRAPRFFDDQEKSIGSLLIDSKRSFANSLAEMDGAYQRMINNLSAQLVEKRKKLELEDNNYMVADGSGKKLRRLEA